MEGRKGGREQGRNEEKKKGGREGEREEWKGRVPHRMKKIVLEAQGSNLL